MIGRLETNYSTYDLVVVGVISIEAGSLFQNGEGCLSVNFEWVTSQAWLYWKYKEDPILQ